MALNPITTTIQTAKHYALQSDVSHSVVYCLYLMAHLKLLVDIITTSEKTGQKPVEDIKLFSDSVTSSEKTGKKLAEDFKLLACSTTSSEKIEKLLEIKKVPSEGKTDTKSAGQITNAICASLITVTKMGGQIKDTTTEGLIANINKFTSRIIDMINVNLMWQKAQTEVGCMKDVENETNEKHIIYYIKESCREMTKYKEIEASKSMSLYIEQLEVEYLYDALYRSGHKDFFNAILGGIQASECSMNRPINHNYVRSDDDRTTYDSQEGKRIGKSDSMINENGYKVQDQQIPSSEANTDASSDESWSSFESTLIRLYRNVIRNETSRMMSSIDMVGFEAEHLFGLERSRIFFDLLDEELFHFGSAGAISEFIPNMAESTVRQHVISFFEHAFGMTSRLMTLLSCPDSKSLKKMTEKEFISLMQCVIDSSSLKTKSNKGTKPSLKVTKGIKWIMVASEEFVRAMGGEIPEDVSYRLRHEDEMIVHGFIDKRHQPSDGKENRHIHYIYFPDDCRLFLYIPTEDGSYWHQLDMQRASRIRRQK